MREIRISQDKQKIAALGLQDVVQGDLLVHDSPAGAVMVSAETDLENLPGYPAGTIAYTAGFGSIWQLSAAGTWEEVG